jgi:non-specific serine/threonine protein kinase
VIADLPDKVEVKALCDLTLRQGKLYQEQVDFLSTAIKTVDRIQRRGLVLNVLMRLKQICNHPSQFIADGLYAPRDSGKFDRLREIAETVASRQEKMLIFTQFREITDVLEHFLSEIFKRRGLILHGSVPVGRRREMVEEFQSHGGPPFFVLSLKAGGTGLNLTNAQHVVHFDRWWNPAVENQATDRAYRIGQKSAVLVHKFTCRGTVEEKIDLLLEKKKTLADNLVEGGSELNLTELSNEDLMNLIRLDLSDL